MQKKIYQNNLDKKSQASLKEKLKIAKRRYQIEKLKFKNEIWQIEKLNKTAKGVILQPLENDLAIKITNLNKVYTSKGAMFPALRNINLSFRKASFNVILGPSGSGKTTLLNMISGLDRATSGIVNVDGANIQAFKTKELTQFRRHHIGFIFQSYNLLPSLNVEENIEVGRSLQVNKLKRKNVSELLEQMEMQENSKKMTYQLSGGQQQRVSIARALSKTPNILIGDEPTGSLDLHATMKIFELFQVINKKQKTTIIIVSHNPKVAELADKVIYVEDGKISKIEQRNNPKRAREVF